MPKDNKDQRLEELEKEIETQRKSGHETVMTLMEVRNQLHWTQTELLKHLTKTNAGVPVTQNQVPNYDSPDFDEFLNKQVDAATITKAIASQVYYGRYVAIQLMGDGSIELRQQSHHLRQTKDGKTSDYVPLRQNFSPETFFLILEAMEFAEKKFGLNRKAVIDKLTGGGEIQFKEAVTLV